MGMAGSTSMGGPPQPGGMVAMYRPVRWEGRARRSRVVSMAERAVDGKKV